MSELILAKRRILKEAVDIQPKIIIQTKITSTEFGRLMIKMARKAKL